MADMPKGSITKMCSVCTTEFTLKVPHIGRVPERCPDCRGYVPVSKRASPKKTAGTAVTRSAPARVAAAASRVEMPPAPTLPPPAEIQQLADRALQEIDQLETEISKRVRLLRALQAFAPATA